MYSIFDFLKNLEKFVIEINTKQVKMPFITPCGIPIKSAGCITNKLGRLKLKKLVSNKHKHPPPCNLKALWISVGIMLSNKPL